jgi:hypothetical protein
VTKLYVRGEVGIRATVGALAVALAVGGLSFHLARMLLAREGLESEAPARVAGDPGRRLLAGSEGANS